MLSNTEYIVFEYIWKVISKWLHLFHSHILHSVILHTFLDQGCAYNGDTEAS